jgi:hypothetical protein
MPRILCPPSIPIGATIEVYGVLCIVIAHHDFGTLTAQAPDGRCWRVTGLPFASR